MKGFRQAIGHKPNKGDDSVAGPTRLCFLIENRFKGNEMQRILWLKFERPPHPDAVAHPATESELRLVAALLKLPWRERNHLSGLLRNWLSQSEKDSPFDRPGVAIRFGEGLYQPIPWRLAKWLACVLPIGEGGAICTRGRIRNWLENESENRVLTPE